MEYNICKYLPYKNLVVKKLIDTSVDVAKISDESDKGYILQVDLKYPKELCDEHSDFPICVLICLMILKDVYLKNKLFIKQNYSKVKNMNLWSWN